MACKHPTPDVLDVSRNLLEPPNVVQFNHLVLQSMNRGVTHTFDQWAEQLAEIFPTTAEAPVEPQVSVQ